MHPDMTDSGAFFSLSFFSTMEPLSFIHSCLIYIQKLLCRRRPTPPSNLSLCAQDCGRNELSLFLRQIHSTYQQAQGETLMNYVYTGPQRLHYSKQMFVSFINVLANKVFCHRMRSGEYVKKT